MKKIFLVLGVVTLTSLNAGVYAHCHYGSSSCIYVVRSERTQNETNFANCKKHFLMTDTTTNYYSNGTRRTFNNHTVLNSDGSILLTNCSDIKHIIFENKHYFIAKKSKSYQVLDSNGVRLTIRNYKSMSEIAPNKLLVKQDKYYGVIDLHEKTIIPVKYKSFEQIGQNLFLTKLNGYYGMIDNSNNIILKNEYDKISPLYDTYLLKKNNKYGLADLDGNILFETKYEKIKRLGEYILVKNNGKYFVLNSFGTRIDNAEYKKIRLERNELQGKTTDNVYVKLAL
ncbi:WG repeat-containing protein [bacterium]|nr:WG repeat-containing protein [bacterium]